MSKILIRQALALLPAGEGFVTEIADICVEGDTITAVGKAPEDFAADRVIDGSRRMVIPGLVNAHTHAYMTVMRNAADDVPFDKWLFEGVAPKEDRMTPEDAYWGATLGFMEMLRSGTTCFNDMQMHIHQTPRAAHDIGIRGVVGRGLSGTVADRGGDRRMKEAVEEIRAWEHDPLLSFTIAPHAPYTCEGPVLQQAADLAEELGLPLHIHLSESVFEVESMLRERGMTPIQYCQSLGLFRLPTVIAHCVQLREEDFEILKDPLLSVVTNPASNMKLGNGFAPVPRLLKEGVRVAIGTDGAASNNALNLFREMGLVTLIHKGVAGDAVSVSSVQALKMATQWGADALGLGSRIGSLEVGKKADLVILNLDTPTLTPQNDPVSALTYSANGSEVDTVLVNGEVVVEKGRCTKIDEERVYYEAGRIAAGL